MEVVKLVLLLISMTAALPAVESGKVLLYPYSHGYTSQLVDILKMGQILKNNSHEVGVLINDVDQKHFKLKGATFHLFPAPADRVTFINDKKLKLTFMTSERSMADTMKVVKHHITMCEQVLSHKTLLQELRDAKYEVIIVDSVDYCGRVISVALNIPTMPYSSTGLSVQPTFFPNLPSFAPATMSCFTSEMTFMERVQNTVMFVIMYYLYFPYVVSFEQLMDKYNLGELAHNARQAYTDDVFLVHTDFALEEQRPLLPNVVLIGGMFVPEAKPLEYKLDEFVEESGNDGVVIVSFGSLIKKMDPTKANAMARALAQLPQRIIWRYDGTPPEDLGSNTLLVPWLPQTDLLARSETKLFVTHCGIHGTYETARHGVPVIAVPLMFDQHANAVKLTKLAKMGVTIDFNKLIDHSFLNALREVLNNSQYLDNARETSRMLQDHARTPQQRFLFWVDYVIRHKGIGRLALKPLKTLNTLQLYCIDVFLFLFAILLLLFGVCAYFLRLCY